MQEHPFAQYVRILGKGKKGSRSLTLDEAQSAMGMILDDLVRPEQLGAFLMLLRVKEESPEELAGFVQAVRARNSAPDNLHVDLDWSTYAGKKRQLPWFLLTALLLAENGHKVFMHGARGHTAGRIYIQDVLSLFNLPSCEDWQQVSEALDSQNFAFMGIASLAPKVSDIIQMRAIFGLRSPVHTLCRMLNPLLSKCSVDGVFHPAYAPMHQQTSAILGVENSLTIRGDGGEAEVRPDANCEIRWIKNKQLSEQQWPRIYPKREVRESELNVENLVQLWRGELTHAYGEGAVISTLAATLVLLGVCVEFDAAQTKASDMWKSRNKTRF
ncbi:MAG: glycosyl transferase family protein [Oceanospirillaceae bacterium]|nr:glycosyl transferase family protein [Oceanospirillaceae bacterium]